MFLGKVLIVLASIPVAIVLAVATTALIVASALGLVYCMSRF